MVSFPFHGVLEKRSEMMGLWQARRVELERGKFSYFKDGCEGARATYSRGDVLCVAAQPPSIVVLRCRQAGGDERSYEFRAADQEEMKLWVQRIQAAFDLSSTEGRSAGVEIQRSNSETFATVASVAGTLLGAVGVGLYGVAKVAGADGWVDQHTETVKSRWLEAQRSTARWREQLENQMGEALVSCDEGKTEMLLDTALAYGLTGDTAPSGIRKAARRAAGAALRDATASEDPKQLKGALLAARRLQVVDVPEFAPAVAKFKEVRRMPEGWDVEKMIEERQVGRTQLLARPDVSRNHALRALVQLMFDRTLRRVVTRDRQGGRDAVPVYLQVVQVAEVQHEQQWVDYLLRREAIKEDIRRSTAPGKAVPDGFLMANVDTEKPLGEAEVAAASSELKVRAPPGARPGDLMEIPSPMSGEVLRLCLPQQVAEGQEFPLQELLASSLPGPPLDTASNEAWLFHGTKPIAAETITTSDFRVDMAGSAYGSLYGRGIYTAENCSKADEYSRADPASGLFTMLLCRVTLGKLLHTAEVTPDPRRCEDACLRGDYHAVLGDRKACHGTFREFCVFDEDQVYANYIVYYRRVLPAAPGR